MHYNMHAIVFTVKFALCPQCWSCRGAPCLARRKWLRVSRTRPVRNQTVPEMSLPGWIDLPVADWTTACETQRSSVWSSLTCSSLCVHTHIQTLVFHLRLLGHVDLSKLYYYSKLLPSYSFSLLFRAVWVLVDKKMETDATGRGNKFLTYFTLVK